MAHNYYKYQGGEDISFINESNLLENHGHEVIHYIRRNEEIDLNGLNRKLGLLSDVIWARKTYDDITRLIKRVKPDVAHIQNFFPLISPSIFHACKNLNVPTVFSVRNFRLLCSNGLFFRDNRNCEDCLGKKVAFPGIIHRCYKGSRSFTTAVVAMQTYHRLFKTWDLFVDRYIVLSKFSKTMMIEGGISPEKIVIKPNFVRDPGVSSSGGDYVIYVGRLSAEKGILSLLAVIKQLAGIPLKIIGDGPLDKEVREFSKKTPEIQFLGNTPHDDTMRLIRQARFLVFPTHLYETFGRVVVESYACGKPVIASHIGSVSELIKENITGLFIDPNNINDISNKIEWLWNHPDESERMGRNAFVEYQKKYTPEINYQKLIDIYSSVISGQEKSNE